MFLAFFLSLVWYSSEVASLTFPIPCKIDDLKCIQVSSIAALPMLLTGDPELGVESSDPLFIEEIVGEVPEFKYQMFNVTVVGTSNAVVSNIKANNDKVNYDFIFTKVKLSGKYKMGGKLFNLPLEGSGDFALTTGKYIMNMDAIFEKYKGEDGKTYGRTNSFELKCHPIERIDNDFKNLYNGQKDLAEAAHKFVNEKWLEVAELLQDPIWLAIMKKIINNFNEHLKHVPLENFVES